MGKIDEGGREGGERGENWDELRVFANGVPGWFVGMGYDDAGV